MAAAGMALADGRERRFAAMRERVAVRELARTATEPAGIISSDWDPAFCRVYGQWRCLKCHGSGSRISCGKVKPCLCTLRKIFRQMISRYHQIQQHPQLGALRYGVLQRGKALYFSRPEMEFCADLELLARRLLDRFHFTVFRICALEGGDWSQAALALRSNRGRIFHAVYRVEAAIGRAARELRPHRLFPLDEYFHGACTTSPASTIRVDRGGKTVKWSRKKTFS